MGGNPPQVSSVPVPYSPPTPQLLLILHNNVFTTLIDTGADVSFIDVNLVQFLSIPNNPSNLTIDLASHSMSQQSLGRTVPLVVTPVLILDHIQYAPSIPPHAFEILDLDVQQYQFIIGKDLLPILFPKESLFNFSVRSPANRWLD